MGRISQPNFNFVMVYQDVISHVCGGQSRAGLLPAIGPFGYFTTLEPSFLLNRLSCRRHGFRFTIHISENILNQTKFDLLCQWSHLLITRWLQLQSMQYYRDCQMRCGVTGPSESTLALGIGKSHSMSNAKNPL